MWFVWMIRKTLKNSSCRKWLMKKNRWPVRQSRCRIYVAEVSGQLFLQQGLTAECPKAQSSMTHVTGDEQWGAASADDAKCSSSKAVSVAGLHFFMQALVNLKTGICFCITTGTLLCRDDFSSSKVLADAESKSNRMNVMLSSGPHRDYPGDPCGPQLWSGPRRSSLDWRWLLCIGRCTGQHRQ